jgi:hypothetical protein
MNTLGAPTAGMYIVGAFPSSVGALEFDTGAEEISTCEIKFAFQYATRIEHTAFGTALDVAAVAGMQTF